MNQRRLGESKATAWVTLASVAGFFGFMILGLESMVTFSAGNRKPCLRKLRECLFICL